MESRKRQRIKTGYNEEEQNDTSTHAVKHGPSSISHTTIVKNLLEILKHNCMCKYIVDWIWKTYDKKSFMSQNYHREENIILYVLCRFSIHG